MEKRPKNGPMVYSITTRPHATSRFWSANIQPKKDSSLSTSTLLPGFRTTQLLALDLNNNRAERSTFCHHSQLWDRAAEGPSRNASNRGINVGISASLTNESILKKINSKLMELITFFVIIIKLFTVYFHHTSWIGRSQVFSTLYHIIWWKWNT